MKIAVTLKNRRGFTLIELLVVIAIIALLSAVVLASLSTARAKARDARRVSDLSNIQMALELYYDKYSTYKVAGTGFSASGGGWVGYENGGTYQKSIARGLYEEGFLNSSKIEDPLGFVGLIGYMMYTCDSLGNVSPLATSSSVVYGIAATKENPSAADIASEQKLCYGPTMNATYGKNFGIGNASF